MKHALRDILLIVALFGAILAAPLVMDMLSSGKDETPAGKQAPAPEKAENTPVTPDARTDGMPPQPQPSDGAEEKGSVMDRLSNIEEDAAKPRPAPPQTNETAPAGDCSMINLAARYGYDPFADPKKTHNTIIMDARNTGMMSITGSGFDLLKDADGGDLHMDGVRITGIGVFDIRNDAPNNLYLSGAALAGIRGRHAIVIGDKQDRVYLDQCLQWKGPLSVGNGAEPLLRYDAWDKDGNEASVSVTEGVQVITPAPPPAETPQAGSSLTITLHGDPEPRPSMDASNCHAVRLGDAQPYNPVISADMKGSSFALPAADLGAMTVVGGKGFDKLKVDDEGLIDSEGKHLVSIEIYDVRNGKPNKVRIFAAGLATMNGRHALVIGDKGTDEVELDPCLDWNEPIAIENGPEPMLRYDAHDQDGNQASVTVTDGVKVIKPAVK